MSATTSRIYGDEEPIEPTQCIYCEAEIQEPGDVPEIDEDCAWARLAEQHEIRCEWIETRAHRINL